MAIPQQIETLINLIEIAEAPGSVTNEMVARAFKILNGDVTALAKAIPPQGVVSGEVMAPEVYGNVIHLPLVIRRADGSSAVHRVELPSATAEKAGLFDLATRKAVNESIAAALSAANAAQSSADGAQKTADSAHAAALAARAAADNAQATADAARSAADDAAALAEGNHRLVTDKIGIPGGIAPLNSTGLIDARFLPSYLDDIVEFAGRVDGSIDIEAGEPPVAWMDGSEAVVYSTFHARFLLSLRGRLYKTWPGCDTYGQSAPSGMIPAAGKIYVDTAADTLSRWSGSGLRELPAVLVLGGSAGQAFPGDEGTALTRAVNALTADLKAHELTARVLTGTLPPVKVNDMVSGVRQRVMDVNLPAGQTYELTVAEMNVTRLDMRLLRPDGAWEYLLYKIPAGQPRRFTTTAETTRLAFSAWDDMDAKVNYADDFQVIMSFTLRRVDPWELSAAEADEPSEQ